MQPPSAPNSGSASVPIKPSKSPNTKSNAAGSMPKAETLAEAISKLDSLRMSQPPSAASTPPSLSAASSRRASGVNINDLSDLSKSVSPAQTPHFGAQTDLLKALDESTKVLRQNSGEPERAAPVSGIGSVVEKPDYSEAKIVVAMVGLPARGKSYLANKLTRYLTWLEYKVDVFNVGQLRRSKARDLIAREGKKADHSAQFFSHTNADAKARREKLAEESLDQLIEWLHTADGNVGILDATNSTYERRAKIRDRVSREPGFQLVFLESYCDDPAIIATNVALKATSGDPDYQGMSQKEAEADFRKRIEQYEAVYQTVSEPDISFLRIMNVGRQVTVNRIQGYLQSRIAFYLMNLHLKPRSIYLSRHGESMYNVEGKIGGDAELSPRGMQYARALPGMIKKHVGDARLEVWTSTLTRTIQTASFLPFEQKRWKALDELDAGVCDGMTYEEIEEKYPEDYDARDEDKFNYRYRGGESYRDVVVRLEPVIMELERQENILIIGHQAIIRCLYAYFMALSQEQLPYIKVPLHTLIRISPKAYGCEEERFSFNIEAVDTHRPKPAKHRKDGPNDTAVEIGSTAHSTKRQYYDDTHTPRS